MKRETVIRELNEHLNCYIAESAAGNLVPTVEELAELVFIAKSAMYTLGLSKSKVVSVCNVTARAHSLDAQPIPPTVAIREVLNAKD